MIEDIERKSITGKKLHIGDYVVRHSNHYDGTIAGIVVGFSNLKVAVLEYNANSIYNPSIRIGNRYFDKTGRLKTRPVSFPAAQHAPDEFAIVTGQEDDNMKKISADIDALVRQYNLYDDIK